VKKIGWAKSQANSLFYIWFTTTDTFDPQGGYLGGDNWGLVTYNQRIKPSGKPTMKSSASSPTPAVLAKPPSTRA